MTETRKLKWSDLNKCGEQWLNGIGNAHGYPMTHCARGWFAGSIGGVETGATGRRCAESALVAAGVITQAEADGLVFSEVADLPYGDAALFGLTDDEFEALAVRFRACPQPVENVPQVAETQEETESAEPVDNS